MNDILIFDKQYHLWSGEQYIGIATYVDDINIGPSFISQAISFDGELINEVYNPTQWKFVNNN